MSSKDYRVTGVSRQELEAIAEEIKNTHGVTSFISDANPSDKRFGIDQPEFTVNTNEQGVLSLLSDNRIVLSRCLG